MQSPPPVSAAIGPDETPVPEFGVCVVGSERPSGCELSSMFERALDDAPQLRDGDGAWSGFWGSFPRSDMLGLFGVSTNSTFDLTVEYGSSAASTGAPFVAAAAGLALMAIAWLVLVRTGCCCLCCRRQAWRPPRRHTAASMRLVLCLGVAAVAVAAAGIGVAIAGFTQSHDAVLRLTFSAEETLRRLESDAECMASIARAIPGDYSAVPESETLVNEYSGEVERLAREADAALDTVDGVVEEADKTIEIVRDVEYYRSNTFVIVYAAVMGAALLAALLALLFHRVAGSVVVGVAVALGLVTVMALVGLAAGLGTATYDGCRELETYERQLLRGLFPEALGSELEAGETDSSVLEQYIECPDRAVAAAAIEASEEIVGAVRDAVAPLLGSVCPTCPPNLWDEGAFSSPRACAATIAAFECDPSSPGLEVLGVTCAEVDRIAAQAVSDIALLRAYTNIAVSLSRCAAGVDLVAEARDELCAESLDGTGMSYAGFLGAGAALCALLATIVVTLATCAPHERPAKAGEGTPFAAVAAPSGGVPARARSVASSGGADVETGLTTSPRSLSAREAATVAPASMGASQQGADLLSPELQRMAGVGAAAGGAAAASGPAKKKSTKKKKKKTDAAAAASTARTQTATGAHAQGRSGAAAEQPEPADAGGAGTQAGAVEAARGTAAGGSADSAAEVLPPHVDGDASQDDGVDEAFTLAGVRRAWNLDGGAPVGSHRPGQL